MVTRTFIDKTNTILKDSYNNFGLYPVVMLNYGLITSRFLIYFDIENLRNEITENYITSEGIKHTLHMYNAGSVDQRNFNKPIPSKDQKTIKHRATSFDIILFKLPKPWDRGCGFDDSRDFWITGDGAVSTESCNWYYSKTGILWNTPGIYTEEELHTEYNKFKNGEESAIFAEQHFEYGNENLNVDITEYVNSLLDGSEENNGIGVAFSPLFETDDIDGTCYTGFFSDETNTFFHPFLETRNNDPIKDNRHSFYIGKENRLYLYSNIGGSMQDLDELPVCKVDDISYEVVHQTKGIYYAKVSLSKNDYEAEMILEDVWSNIKFDGESLDDVTMEFVTLPMNNFMKIGKKPLQAIKTSVVLNGIKHDEKINRDGIREISVDFRKPYTHRMDEINGDVYYRVYTMDGDKEIPVIEWDCVNLCNDYNYFNIDTKTLIPQKYRIDIKVENGKEIQIFKDELRFEIVNKFDRKRM